MRAAALLLLLPLSARAQPRRIQIGILDKAEALTLKPQGKFLLIDGASDDPAELAPNRSYKVKGGSFLKLGSLILSGSARLKPADDENRIKVGEQLYRGDLLLKLNKDQTVTVVNELDIEDYLLGVLPDEMDPAWPIEALKAQAVVARTFAYANLGKYKRRGFDLSPDTRSQVYNGAARESESIRLAVKKTVGEVIGWKGELLPVYYHACCGGHTTDTASVWSGASAPKPLRGVKDKVCALSPHAHWTAYFSDEEILAAAQPKLLIGSKLKSFKVGRRDPAGFAREFVLKIDSHKITVSANDLRVRLGARALRSTKIESIRGVSGGFELEGGGLGHGVGLCQWGAKLLAERGVRYEKILSHYFPGSTLSVVDE